MSAQLLRMSRVGFGGKEHAHRGRTACRCQPRNADEQKRRLLKNGDGAIELSMMMWTSGTLTFVVSGQLLSDFIGNKQLIRLRHC